MKRRSGKVWVAGIALAQLFVVGVDVALLCPTSSDAEKMAGRVGLGMTESEMIDAIGWRDYVPGTTIPPPRIFWRPCDDSSEITITMARPLPAGQEQRVEHVQSTPATRPVHPLDHLRRTLARVFPILAE
jgi:hypothetical protein